MKRSLQLVCICWLLALLVACVPVTVPAAAPAASEEATTAPVEEANESPSEEANTAVSTDAFPVTIEHTLLAGRLPSPHRDPFDRLLGAQAIQEKANLVTVDPAFKTFPGLPVLW